MKVLLKITSVIVSLCMLSPANAKMVCAVQDIYIDNCPDLSAWLSDKYENCVCTNTIPKRCRVMDKFSSCPPWAEKCNCADDGSGDSGGGGGCTVLSCNACVDTNWTDIGNGHQSRLFGGTCSGNTCTSHGTCSNQQTQYRCSDGFYGTSVNGSSGCLLCPRATDKYTDPECRTPAPGTSVAGSNSVKTDCYLPDGTYYTQKGRLSGGGINCRAT